MEMMDISLSDMVNIDIGSGHKRRVLYISLCIYSTATAHCF